MGGGRGAKGEGEAGSSLSREPDAGAKGENLQVDSSLSPDAELHTLSQNLTYEQS